MKTSHTELFRSLIIAALLGAGLWLALASVPAARANDYNRAPDLPPVCENIEAPAGNKLAFRVYAVGVQRYRWNGAGWDFVEPVATLYADSKYNLKVGAHYAGPTWESILGGKVVATRVEGCSPDPASISWLLLRTTSADGLHLRGHSIRGAGSDPVLRRRLSAVSRTGSDDPPPATPTLMVEALAEGRSEAELEKALDEYLEIGGFLDVGLGQQAEFNLENLQRSAGRTLTEDERAEFITKQHQALRWTFLGSGMTHANFLSTLERLSPALRRRLEQVAPVFC